MNVIHRYPKRGSIYTPCCNRTVFELPACDQLSSFAADVTCPAPGAAGSPVPEGDPT